jgi:hypothetical protein
MQAVDYWRLTNILRLIARFLAPFLSHKGLVLRQLVEKHGLIEFAEGIAGFESSKNTEAGKACTPYWERNPDGKGR